MARSPTRQSARTHVAVADAAVEKRYEAGRLRVAAIVSAAKGILVDGGYSEFTLRRVALKASIPLRHLQYYFPTKNELLRALCESICEDYIAKCDALAAHSGASPKQNFRDCIKFLIDDNRDTFSNTLFFELWAMACHDEYANRLLDKLYLHYRLYVEGLIRKMRPATSAQLIQSRALQIVALIEGLTLFIGKNKPQRTGMRDVIKDACKNIMQLATAN